MSEIMREALATAIERYGSDAIEQALRSAVLFHGMAERSRHAVDTATDALTCGDVEGVLIFHFTGYPNDVPAATFLTGDAKVLLDRQATESVVVGT